MTVVSIGATLTKEEMLKLIESTENLKEVLFELEEDTVEFICDLEADDPLMFKINSEKYKLTAESTEQALKFAKIPKGIIDEYDIDIIVPLVNWYYANKGGELKALVKNKTILAFTRPGTEIYSVEELIKEMVRALDNFDITEYHFDNVYHTLKETHFSLITPHKSHEIEDGDVLRAGVFVQHSVVGAKPLVMHGYISRDYYENGMISAQTVEKWNRKTAKKSDDVTDAEADEDHYDVYTWAYDTTDTILRAFNREAKAVEWLAEASVGNHAGTLFGDLFTKNNIPVSVQKLVREEYVDQPGQTLYDFWNSITLAADRSELDDAHQTRKKVREAAGKLAAHPQSCSQCHRLTAEDA